MRCTAPRSVGEKVYPCGKCGYCLEKKRGQWTFRLEEEMKVASSAYFLTFTYSDEHLPMFNEDDGVVLDVPSLRKSDMQRMFKRLRKAQKEQGDDRTIRYYTVGEYGSKSFRPHYHSIVFNLSQESLLLIQKIWKGGNVFVGQVTPASIHYVTKYHLNKHKGWDQVSLGRQKPFLICRLGPVVSALVM